MTENINRISLCSNCKNAPTCTFPKDPNRPSFYCEEFEIEDVHPSVKTIRKDVSLATPSVDAEDSGKFIGLCSNCDNRRTCGFPRLEGGVWHCEEYQ